MSYPFAAQELLILGFKCIPEVNMLIELACTDAMIYQNDKSMQVKAKLQSAATEGS